MDLSIIDEILYTEEEIAAKVKEIAQQISQDYQGKELTVIGILKGASVFTSDLIRELDIPVFLEFMSVSSYGDSTYSSGEVQILKDTDESVEGKDLLIIEDIVDTGNTLSYLVNQMHLRGAKSVKVCTLLDKPGRRKVNDFTVDYKGFELADDAFIVGYGLDYAQQYRQLPYIADVVLD